MSLCLGPSALWKETSIAIVFYRYPMPSAFFIDHSSNCMKLSVSDYFMVGDTKLYASLFLVFVAFLLAYKGMTSLT